MGRLKLQMQVTVDGMDPDGGNDELSWDEVCDYSHALLETADTIVLGGRTAAEFIPYWDAIAAKPEAAWHEVGKQIAQARKVVFSSTFENPGWNNTEVERGGLADAIRRLKATNRKDIIVYGGVSFVASLVREGLIDEFHLFVNPVAAGQGRSVFAGLEQPRKLALRKAIGFKSGHVLLHYEPA